MTPGTATSTAASSYEYTCKGPEGEAPLYLSMGQALVHDSTPGFLNLNGLVHLYSECHVDLASLDAAHDNHATYQLGRLLGVRLAIDLNLGRAKGNPVVKPLQLDQNGNPVYRVGHCLVRRGRIGKHIRFDCPATRKRRRLECHEECFGRCRCLRQEADLRFMTDPPGGSKERREAYKARTCTERSHDMKKNDYRLQECRVRSLRRRLFPLYMIAACAQHVKLWTKHEAFDLEQFLNPQAA
ncbi:MAG: hypothetical protein M0031_11775 [Thermaerobacter sp.]|nr:hypothetical protein [Thermaerobacter sp.]